MKRFILLTIAASALSAGIANAAATSSTLTVINNSSTHLYPYVKMVPVYDSVNGKNYNIGVGATVSMAASDIQQAETKGGGTGLVDFDDVNGDAYCSVNATYSTVTISGSGSKLSCTGS